MSALYSKTSKVNKKNPNHCVQTRKIKQNQLILMQSFDPTYVRMYVLAMKYRRLTGAIAHSR